MSKLEDFTGRKIGKVTVLERIEANRDDECVRTQWLCQCECGMTVVFVARDLKRSVKPSCHHCNVKNQQQPQYEKNANGFMIRKSRER